MGNNGRSGGNQFSTERRDSSYHLRLLGVLAVLVDGDVWQDALRIVDLLDRKATELEVKEEPRNEYRVPAGRLCACSINSDAHLFSSQDFHREDR